MNRVYIDCDCSTPDHTVLISYDKDEEYPEHSYFTISTQLKPDLGFFRRIWAALKYVFRPTRQCGFGGWNCSLITKAKMHELQSLVEAFYAED